MSAHGGWSGAIYLCPGEEGSSLVQRCEVGAAALQDKGGSASTGHGGNQSAVTAMPVPGKRGQSSHRPPRSLGTIPRWLSSALCP